MLTTKESRYSKISFWIPKAECLAAQLGILFLKEKHLWCTYTRDLLKVTLLRIEVEKKPSTWQDSNPRPLPLYHNCCLTRAKRSHCSSLLLISRHLTHVKSLPWWGRGGIFCFLFIFSLKKHLRLLSYCARFSWMNVLQNLGIVYCLLWKWKTTNCANFFKVNLVFPQSLLPTFSLPDLLDSHSCTNKLSWLGLSNQVGSTTDHL